MRGSWQVAVQIQTDQVLVIHSKREHSHDDAPARHVEFEWQLVLALPLRNLADFVARVEVGVGVLGLGLGVSVHVSLDRSVGRSLFSGCLIYVA